MSKHTKEPWKIANLHKQGLYTNGGAINISAEDGLVCSVDLRAKVKRGQEYNAKDPERDANAAIISAAPDLLASLKDIVDSAMAQREEDEGRKSPLLRKARAAIAKAEIR